MLVNEKPPLDEALLAHYGIPGMKWGHRKSDRTGYPEMSSRKKAAIGTAAAVGTAALLYNKTTRNLGIAASKKVLRGMGKVSISVLRTASDALGVTGVPKRASTPVKVKLTTIERIKASLTRGREFLSRDRNRSGMTQLQSGLRLPPNVLTDALF